MPENGYRKLRFIPLFGKNSVEFAKHHLNYFIQPVLCLNAAPPGLLLRLAEDDQELICA
jgi:hypothetical protein